MDGQTIFIGLDGGQPQQLYPPRANPPLLEAMARQVGRSVQRQVANRVAGSLVRGLLGGLFRGR